MFFVSGDKKLSKSTFVKRVEKEKLNCRRREIEKGTEFYQNATKVRQAVAEVRVFV